MTEEVYNANNNCGNKDENLIRAIDRIELDKKAQRRMYENILEKAERRSGTVKLFRIVKPLVSAAACVCLVIAAAVLLQNGVNNADSFSGSSNLASRDKTSAEAADMVTAAAGAAPESTDYTVEYDYADSNEEYEENINENAFAASTSVITTTFNIVPGAEAVSVDSIPEIADISSDGAAPSADRNVSGSSVHDDYEVGEFDAAEAVGVEEVSKVDTEFTENFSLNLPYEAKWVSFSETESDLDLLYGDFEDNGNIYSVKVSMSEDVQSGAEAEKTILEETDYGFAVTLTEDESYDNMVYRVRWYNGTYYFILESSCADREEVIRVTGEFIAENR